MIGKDEIRNYNKTHRILTGADDFVYLRPHPGLRGLISNYTITFPGDHMISDRYTVIPHGSATLVFSCREGVLYGDLFGPATKPSVVGGAANRAGMLFIVEFRPAGLSAFANWPQTELADRIIPFELINPVLNSSMEQILESASGLHELLVRIEDLFLLNVQSEYPSALKHSVHNIIENKGILSTRELAGCAFYSERQLNRIFHRHLGMSVKTFSRLVRINNAVKRLNNPHSSITNICLSSGFYDLSHFIHDFKAVSGVTPQEYRRRMSDFYSEIAKF